MSAISQTRSVVEGYYAAFNSKNYQDMLDLVDVEIVHEPNQGNPRFGKGLFSDFLKKMHESYDEKLTDFVYYESADEPDKAAVRFTVNGRYLKAEDDLPPAHGQEYVLPAAAFLEVKDGKVTKVSTFYNLEEWIRLVSK